MKKDQTKKPRKLSSEEIKDFRVNSLNMTQAEFAELLSVNPFTVKRWEENLSRPCGSIKLKLLELIEKFYEKSPDYDYFSQNKQLNIIELLSGILFTKTKRFYQEILAELLATMIHAARYGQPDLTEKEIQQRIGEGAAIISNDFYPYIKAKLISQFKNEMPENTKKALLEKYGSYENIIRIEVKEDLLFNIYPSIKPSIDLIEASEKEKKSI